MRFALGYPIIRIDPPPEFLAGDSVAAVAAGGERAGFSAVSFTEHPAPPQTWRDDHGHDALDPFIALAYAAAASSSLQLLTYLAVVPYRNPFLMAKSVATLDRLSGGRVLLGLGTGYLRGEFDALGVDFSERNELFEEAVEAAKLAWTGLPVRHHGLTTAATEAVSRPVPRQRPHPPIWLGGNAALTRRRVAEYAQGWMPIPNRGAQVARRATASLSSVKQLIEMINGIKEEREQLGRLGPLDILYLIEGVDALRDSQRYLDEVQQLESIGVTWLSWSPTGASVAAAVDQIGHFGEAVIAAVSEDSVVSDRTGGVDRDAIVDLYARYAQIVDTKDFPRLGEIFSTDIVADYGTTAPITGLAALEDFMREGHSGVTASRHRAIDFEVVVEAGTARCVASKRNSISRVGSVDSLFVGQYRDELVLTSDGWRISSRVSQHL